MTFNEYQELAWGTAIYPNRGNNLYYPALGLAGETGEVCEKIKKLMRDKGGIADEAFKEMLKKELGDVWWYLAAISSELGLSLDDVARTNIDKLQSRQKRDKLHGDGDNR